MTNSFKVGAEVRTSAGYEGTVIESDGDMSLVEFDSAPHETMWLTTRLLSQGQR